MGIAAATRVGEKERYIIIPHQYERMRVSSHAAAKLFARANADGIARRWSLGIEKP